MNEHLNVLNNIVKNFFRGYINFSLSEPELKLFDWNMQNKFLNQTVKSDLLKKYPVSTGFTKLFLKKIIKDLEAYQEIHDDIYSFLCTTLNNTSNTQKYYRHYIIDDDLNNIVTMKETKNIVVNGTTGMKTWEASLVLTDWIFSNKKLFENKTILELGSGIGFTGIALSKYCNPKLVVMTDCNDNVLQGICENVQINIPDTDKAQIGESVTFKNNQGTNIEIMTLDWKNVEDVPDNVNPDIVIGSDIVYDPSILDILCATIKHFIAKSEKVDVYVASVIRNEDTFNSFLDTLIANDLDYLEISHTSSNHLYWDPCINKSLLKINKK